MLSQRRRAPVSSKLTRCHPWRHARYRPPCQSTESRDHPFSQSTTTVSALALGVHTRNAFFFHFYSNDYVYGKKKYTRRLCYNFPTCNTNSTKLTSIMRRIIAFDRELRFVEKRAYIRDLARKRIRQTGKTSAAV